MTKMILKNLNILRKFPHLDNITKKIAVFRKILLKNNKMFVIILYIYLERGNYL